MSVICYRTWLHKDADKEVFGPLLNRHPYHRKVGSNGHSFLSGTLEQVTGLTEYDRDSLCNQPELTGEELYNYVYDRVGTIGYLGAVETTQAQAGLIQTYEQLINPPPELP